MVPLIVQMGKQILAEVPEGMNALTLEQAELVVQA
jgi:hypothetical protein